MYINQQGGLINEKDLPENADIVGGTSTTSTGGSGPDATKDQAAASKQFLKIGEKFINIDNLSIDLIESVNPFHGAYEILSKSVTATMLKTIQEAVSASKSQLSEEEAVMLWPRIKEFTQQNQRAPSLHAPDPIEVRLAEALAYIKQKKQQSAAKQES